jgi:hypothetical protein
MGEDAKVVLRETECEAGGWLYVAYKRAQWQATGGTVMNF